MQFSHLHVHTQYSLLDGASSIRSILDKAVKDNMPAVAITDHGNLFGVFEFVAEAYKLATHSNRAIKPIIGCEFYITQDTSKKDKSTKLYHQLLLAKNETGYKNLLKLSHFSYTQGFYKKPLIDKEQLKLYHQGLIASSCCLAAMVPQALLQKGEDQAEQELKWWIDLFGEDYYLELQRHSLSEQEKLNGFLKRMSTKYKLKMIATNDTHYTEQDYAPLHEILLCINTASFMSEPPKKEESASDSTATLANGKKVRHRFAFPNDKFFFKTSAEMQTLFEDIPEAIDNTNDIVDKVKRLHLEKDILLPSFPLPPNFTTQYGYLRHLAEKGIRKKYDIITPEIQERLDFELSIIEKMDYSGYFLIVADFIQAAKRLKVAVGPGRGSAAGSLVAYASDITNIDPLKYNLLFERFLNPERRGMPDIDIDFDDVGRSKVIDYIVKRYGRSQTAQIVTFNSMGAKSAIKDVARVLEFDFQKSNSLSKLLHAQTSIKRQLGAPLSKSEDSLEVKDAFQPIDIERVERLRETYESREEIKKIVDIAKGIDGRIRNVGVHAAGIIIAPRPVEEMIPVCTVKDNNMLVTQIEGKYIEGAGVVKIDILGISNLSTIQVALKLIRERHGKDIDINTIPLDDKNTFQLYQRGDTVGTFQFESEGMRKYLRDLKPDKLEDLIALNALYRPGPMQYIPEFIERKQGLKKIQYDIDIMEDVLKETYGITVYQEQVMLLAQLLSNFSKGDADVLRKAMGKKQSSVLNKMKLQFVQGALAKKHPKQKIEKIWHDWESFAQYAFNKSHSTCYAYVAYRTAYLKANYPHEYMTALLEGAKDIKAQSKIMRETQRMQIPILGPSVNESETGFSITKNNAIRFGLSSVKGFGEKDSEIILESRNENQHFQDLFHCMRCLQGKIGPGKLESLVKAGALDCFTNIKRPQYLLHSISSKKTFIEELVNYSKSSYVKIDAHAPLLFDQKEFEALSSTLPSIPKENKQHGWSQLEMLKYEKEMLGTYISRHPLSSFQFEFNHFSFTSLLDFEEINKLEWEEQGEEKIKTIVNSAFLVGGIIETAKQKISRRGSPYISVSLSDFSHTYEFTFFGQDFPKVKDIAIVDSYIYLHLRYIKDKYKPEKLRLSVQGVGTLEEFRETFTKEIHLYARKEDISPTCINYLEKYIQDHKRDKAKRMFIHCEAGSMTSFTIKVPQTVDFADELVEFIEQNNHIIYCKCF